MKRIYTPLLGAGIFAFLSLGQAVAADPVTTVRMGWIGDTHFTDVFLMSQMMTDPKVKLEMNKFQLSQDELNALAGNKIGRAHV